MASPKAKLLGFENALNLLLVFVPVALVLYWLDASAVAVFATSALAIVPLAGLMGKATEHLAERLGEAAGGLLNATFGNAAELIIALVALRAGLHEVVKASLTGSIIGNILLVFGLAVLLGGLRYETLRFNRTAAAMNSTLLTRWPRSGWSCPPSTTRLPAAEPRRMNWSFPPKLPSCSS